MKKKIYLDYNATSFCTVWDKHISEILKNPLNPSSNHFFGRYAKSILEKARLQVAKLVNINDFRLTNIVFTSSATEANNIIMKNFYKENILTLSTEHESIIKHKVYCKNIKIINVDKNGVINLDNLEMLLKKSDKSKKTLVTTMMANNETGVIQPIKEITKIAKKYNAFVHSDWVQSAGKITTDFFDSQLDSISISAHKIGGLPGAGALIYRHPLSLTPQIIGGGQEKSIRSGTENVLHCYLFGLAAEKRLLNLDKYHSHTKKLQSYLEGKIKKVCKEIKIWSCDVERIPNTSSIMMPKVNSTIQLIKFDMQNIAISSGSACSSGSMGKESYVLKAMQCCREESKCTIRVSTDINTTMDEINSFIDTWKNIQKAK